MEGGSNSEAQPESKVAQNFAADLDSMFGLKSGDPVATLSQNVEEKKANVTSGQSELEQLEAKLRETEQRLAKVSRQNSPSRQADSGASNTSAQSQTSPLAQKPTYPDDRPPTGQRPQSQSDGVEAKVQNMPGAMPGSQTQLGGRDDFVIVDRGNAR